MRKTVLLSIILLSVSNLVFCQIEQKMKKERVVTGFIIKDGQQVPGYLKKMGREYFNDAEVTAPWEFQESIRFIPKDLFDNNEKIKNNLFDKYGPKDCEGYIYENALYESVKYAETVVMGRSVLPQRMFLEKVVDDKISLYVHFSKPPPADSEDVAGEPVRNEYTVPHLLCRVGPEGTLKRVNSITIEKELADCPLVLEKQAKGLYEKIGPDDNKSFFTHVLNNTLFRENARVNAILDYNRICK